MSGTLTRSRFDLHNHGQNETVEQRIRHQLEQHCHFRGRTQSINIQHERGRLILRGRLPSFYLKQLLQTALRDVEGVQEIDNRVDVVSYEGLSSVRTPHN